MIFIFFAFSKYFTKLYTLQQNNNKKNNNYSTKFYFKRTWDFIFSDGDNFQFTCQIGHRNKSLEDEYRIKIYILLEYTFNKIKQNYSMITFCTCYSVFNFCGSLPHGLGIVTTEYILKSQKLNSLRSICFTACSFSSRLKYFNQGAFFMTVVLFHFLFHIKTILLTIHWVKQTLSMGEKSGKTVFSQWATFLQVFHVS